ncbi:alpha/beta hydrolase [Nakamurella flava]|uniref:alpha/beta hydrolase n=1 Tax=Nakamurella flava TaxID=2576308 RepID=UPI0014087875|nr:alpha/beta hydrolase [Nakamurella flava]
MSGTVLSAAAAACRVPDPGVIADRIERLPVDELATCAQFANAASVALFQGSKAAQSAAGVTASGWTTGRSAVTAIGQTAMAAMAGRATMDAMAGAIGGARATFAQLQFQSQATVVEAESALTAAGFDPSTGRVANAPATTLPYPLSNPSGTTIDGTAATVLPTVTAAHERLTALEARLESALRELVTVLRTDPRDMLQRIPQLPPDSAPTIAGPGLSDLAHHGFDLMTDAAALTIGALGAAIGSALAGGKAGSGANIGGVLVDATRRTGAALEAAVQSAARSVDDIMAPAPATATQADAEARARLEADLASPERVTRHRAVNIHAALVQAEASGQAVQLLTYTPATASSQGTAAIGIGDMGAADTVTTMVPGVQNSADDMSGALGEASRLQTEAHRRSPGQTTAVVAWFGYDIPLTNGYTPDRIANIAAAEDDRAAVAGGAALASDLSRFRLYAPDTARQVVIGHSMGSVVASAAAVRGAVIDDLVLLGSPGASRLADTVRDYPGVPTGHTHVVALDDPVTRSGLDNVAMASDLVSKATRLATSRVNDLPQAMAEMITDPAGPQFGPDPAAAPFGASVIDANAGHSDHTISTVGSYAAPLFGLAAPLIGYAADQADDLQNHPQSVYLGDEALTAVADITVGNIADVPIKPGR